MPTRSPRGSVAFPGGDIWWVAIDYLCRRCEQEAGRRTILLRHAISTTAGRFEDERDMFRGADAVEEQTITAADGTTYKRIVMDCPRCPNRPQFRRDKLMAALELVYEPGAALMIRELWV